MKLFLQLAVLLTALASCGTAKEQSEPVPGALEYLALGDSYTIGESVEEHERFPMQLAAKLKAAGKETNVTIVAKTGWTTGELASGIRRADIEGKKYDVVTLLIGVNNEFRGKDLEEYKKEFSELLGQAIEFAGGRTGRVFVVSIPDYGFTPYGEEKRTKISPRIDQFNNAAKTIAASRKVAFTDITPASRRGLDDPALVAADGLHPSGKQYAIWVEKLFPPVSASLRK